MVPDVDADTDVRPSARFDHADRLGCSGDRGEAGVLEADLDPERRQCVGDRSERGDGLVEPGRAGLGVRRDGLEVAISEAIGELDRPVDETSRAFGDHRIARRQVDQVEIDEQQLVVGEQIGADRRR